MSRIPSFALVPIAFALALAALAAHVAAAELSDKLLDALRLEGKYQHDNVSVFDVAAYERVLRREIAVGTFKQWDRPVENFHAQPRPEHTLDRTYYSRIGGFKREELFEADEIGEILAQNRIKYAENPGNGLLESLMICRKYGLRRYFYAPDAQDILPTHMDAATGDLTSGPASGTKTFKAVKNTPIELPYLRSEFPGYEQRYGRELEYLAARLREFSALFPEHGGLIDRKFAEDPEALWVLFTGYDLSPLAIFWAALRRDFDAINREFREETGFDLPLDHEPTLPEDKAKRIRMWSWIRERYAMITASRARVFREKIGGRGILASNEHFESQVDFERYGKTFDQPGFAIRPMLSDNPLVWEHYVGYGTRLGADLTHKLPVISPRINMPASGARVVPHAGAVRHWYDQAIQNGCAGFYIWVQDYPASPNSYRGPSPGNPDPSALGKLRWETALEIARQTSETKIFVPPIGDTAILVSLDSCAIGNTGWKRVFSNYIELKKAGVWSNFISDQGLKEGTSSLSRFKTVYIPHLEYVERMVAEQLVRYAEAGGTVICTDPTALRHDSSGKDLTDIRKKLFGVSRLQIQTAAAIVLEPELGGIRLMSYGGATFSPIVDEGIDIIGRYPSGAAAVTSKQHERGRAIFFGASLTDLILHNMQPGFKEDDGRKKFYTLMEQRSGASNQSWVWQVNLRNLATVTGTKPYLSPPPAKGIDFKRYLR